MGDKNYKELYETANRQYEKVVEQNKSLQAELRAVKLGTCKLGHGFTLKTEIHEENGRKFYIIEVYKDGHIQYFDEAKIEG